jgi:hypothetical protein
VQRVPPPKARQAFPPPHFYSRVPALIRAHPVKYEQQLSGPMPNARNVSTPKQSSRSDTHARDPTTAALGSRLFCLHWRAPGRQGEISSAPVDNGHVETHIHKEAPAGLPDCFLFIHSGAFSLRHYFLNTYQLRQASPSASSRSLPRRISRALQHISNLECLA